MAEKINTTIYKRSSTDMFVKFGKKLQYFHWIDISFSCSIFLLSKCSNNWLPFELNLFRVETHMYSVILCIAFNKSVLILIMQLDKWICVIRTTNMLTQLYCNIVSVTLKYACLCISIGQLSFKLLHIMQACKPQHFENTFTRKYNWRVCPLVCHCQLYCWIFADSIAKCGFCWMTLKVNIVTRSAAKTQGTAKVWSTVFS